MHEADLEDDKFDAPEAAGLDAILRDPSMTSRDETILDTTHLMFDGLYDYYRHSLLGKATPA